MTVISSEDCLKLFRTSINILNKEDGIKHEHNYLVERAKWFADSSREYKASRCSQSIIDMLNVLTIPYLQKNWTINNVRSSLRMIRHLCTALSSDTEGLNMLQHDWKHCFGKMKTYSTSNLKFSYTFAGTSGTFFKKARFEDNRCIRRARLVNSLQIELRKYFNNLHITSILRQWSSWNKFHSPILPANWHNGWKLRDITKYNGNTHLSTPSGVRIVSSGTLYGVWWNGDRLAQNEPITLVKSASDWIQGKHAVVIRSEYV